MIMQQTGVLKYVCAHTKKKFLTIVSMSYIYINLNSCVGSIVFDSLIRFLQKSHAIISTKHAWH